MANSDGKKCYGKKFRVGEKWYWYCGVNESFTIVDHYLSDGDSCPLCKRPIYSAAVEVDTRIKIVRQIRFKMGKSWIDLEDITF